MYPHCLFHKIQSPETGIIEGHQEMSTPNNLGLPTYQRTNADAEQNVFNMDLQVGNNLEAGKDREGIVGGDNWPDPGS